MHNPNRLLAAKAPNARINRDKPLKFTFNGKEYTGYQGDTLASALIANGISVVGRSFKYHRPRGIIGSGAEEPNALLQIGEGAKTIPNLRATQVMLYDGLVSCSVNAWPSVEFDVGSINNVFNKLLPAGFYYKTFMWPKSFWHKYEEIIRKSAGLGKSPELPDPHRYEKHNDYYDVVVAGAGPSGLSAALIAAKAGLRVLLVEEQNELGGSLLRERVKINNADALEWIADVEQQLASYPLVKVLKNSQAYGYFDHNFIAINEKVIDAQATKPGPYTPRERIWRIRAKQVVIATGSVERPLAFHNNDKPGIMLASAVSTYVNRYGVTPGNSVVVFGNNNSIYQTVMDLLEANVLVAAVVDSRSEENNPYADILKAQNVPCYFNSVVTSAEGGKRVKSVSIAKIQGGDIASEEQTVHCDTVAVSGGWSPLVHLHAQSGAKAVWDDVNLCFKPGKSVQNERSCGASNAQFSLFECISTGEAAAMDALTQLGLDANEIKKHSQNITAESISQENRFLTNIADASLKAIEPLWLVPSKHKEGHGGKQFVDFQNDTSAADIQLAVREGFHSIEHIKRYTALGFGTDQGKLGNINGMAIAAKALGKTIPETGTTTFRPPYTPVTLGATAGRELGDFFEPIRKTAMHQWHQEKGAEFEDVGQWKRAWYYPKNNEDLDAAVARECLAVRNSVGIMDASTLGKIDIKGPDAGEFLNRVYTNAWKKLGVGKCRYGFMLGEDGMVMDDGVTTCVNENHYYMTTTTGGAARIYGWLEEWLQTEWTDLEVFVTSVTDHWSTIAVVGPESRKVLEKICTGIDLSAEAFPFMSMREGNIAGVDGRVFRISFSGEIAYEINVPAHYGRHVWEACMAAGAEFNITPYGTETMHVLRAEKGFIIVGQDTDGSVTPYDLGMDWIVSKNKDFIGCRSLSREDCVRENRKQLVGLKPEIAHQVLPEGAQIIENPDISSALENKEPVPMIGHVTSSYYSAALGHSFALALIKNGHNRIGETVYAPLSDGRMLVATVCHSVFYDVENKRQSM